MAGRRRFSVPGARTLNVGCGNDIREKDGWTNMDGYVQDPRVVAHDVLQVPWPFKDDSFDVVYASHILEHIPPVFRSHRGTQRDALFEVMEEIHRVLKPNGILHAAMPLGGQDTGLMHPQHYRQWRPEWFQYLDRSKGWESRAYHSADFTLEKLRFNRDGFRAKDFLRLGKNGHPLVVHLWVWLPFLRPFLSRRNEMEALLRAVKPSRN